VLSGVELICQRVMIACLMIGLSATRNRIFPFPRTLIPRPLPQNLPWHFHNPGQFIPFDEGSSQVSVAVGPEAPAHSFSCFETSLAGCLRHARQQEASSRMCILDIGRTSR